jgi:hypothetical protein
VHTVAGAAPAAASSPPACVAGQLRVSGGLQGATQSLLGTLTLANRTGRACGLPAAPRRVSFVIGTQVLPTLTLRRLRGSMVPPGRPTRVLPAHGLVVLGLQWRNWCGAPRGDVLLSVEVGVSTGVEVRGRIGPVTTPVCVDPKHSSTVTVSRFLRRRITAVTWRRAVALVSTCKAKRVEQAHSRTVTVSLRNGRSVYTVEPRIDAIIPVVNRATKTCGPIVFATE